MSTRRAPETSDIVAFLRRPAAYPHAPADVSVIETHMSWVFLGGAEVYKLKKAIRLDEIDFSTPAKRRRNCLEEVRLNRRLAPGVYLGVEALTRTADGGLSIGGEGEPVDWLVHMRRLPADRHLEAVMAAGRVRADEPAIRAAAASLAHFFAQAPVERLSAADYCRRLEDGVRSDRRALLEPRYGLPGDKVEALAQAQLDCLRDCAAVFGARAEAGRIVEGHGDLRPEHVWLDPVPAILDCVEFDRNLRTMDPADELAFLGLECERLGALEVGDWFLQAYIDATDDAPPAALLHFYRVYRALRRASIAARHLDDPSVADPQRFLERARHYLAMVRPVTCPAA